jgi:hypothetical protein
MTDRNIRPRAWVAVLASVAFVGGAAVMPLLANPFSFGTDQAGAVKFWLLCWVLSGALALSGGFRLLAWRTFRLGSDSIESRGMWGRRRHLWADLVRAERKTRVLEMTFTTGFVRVLANHYPAADLSAIETAAKMAVKKTV